MTGKGTAKKKRGVDLSVVVSLVMAVALTGVFLWVAWGASLWVLLLGSATVFGLSFGLTLAFTRNPMKFIGQLLHNLNW